MEKQWDSAAIDGVYDNLIERTGRLLDFVGVQGLGEVFKAHPVLSAYFTFVETLERELLIQWKIKSEEGLEVLFLRHRKWLRESLRKEGSIFEIWGKLVRELSTFLDQYALSQENHPWNYFLKFLWFDISFWKGTGWCQGERGEKIQRVSDGYLMLRDLEPYHLILSFLNLIELGCGSRPDVWPLGKDDAAEKELVENRSFLHTGIFEEGGVQVDPQHVSTALSQFWLEHSGGIYSRFPAFVIDSGEKILKGVHPEKRIALDELVGIDFNIEKLKRNTEHFLNNRYADHILLWGGRGTGKSSCVLALLEEYVKKGLRLVEMPPSTLHLLPEVSRQLAGKREKFIIFCDDLSFDKGDDSYKHLKSVMDGSVLNTAKNVLLIATSNKKDLVFRGGKTTLHGDPEDHQCLDEKRAIDDRFGLKLFFDVPVFKDLKSILFHYADKTGISYTPDKLFIEFRQFAQKNNHDKPAGRTVKQFISGWVERNK